MPLIAGALLALILREIHIRHPLPLVESGYVNAWQRPKPKIPPSPMIVAESGETPEDAVAEDGGILIPAEPFAETTVEENVLPPGEVSVFDHAANIPKNLPVNDALDSMMAAISAAIPNDLESRIEETTRLKDDLPQEVRPIKDDLDLDDLEDLVAALPKSKIDFSQEVESDSDSHEAVSTIAKELLGEDFDFDALETQPHQSSAAVTLDIREDTPGLVQVSSPFLVTDTPQLTNLTEPQTVCSTFSDDWIQVIEPTEGGASPFSFTEELQPMFVRKKKAN